MSKHLSIIVGSVLGASEYVAEALEQVAQSAGFTTTLQFEPDLDALEKRGHG